MAKPITVTVAGNAGPLRKSLQGADSDLAKFGKAVSDNAKKLALGFAAIGAGAVAGLGAAVKAAAEDQKAQALLADQLRKTTDATSAQILAMEQFVDVTQRATGIADDELRPALATLTRATGDLTQAQELLQLGLDISAGSGKSLEGISLALAKATNGNLGAFTKLGIPLDENIIKTKDFAAAQEVLAKQFGGASTVAANTFSGQMSRLRIVIGEAVESIGYAILENDYFQDSMAKFPNAVQAAIDAFVLRIKQYLGWARSSIPWSTHVAIELSIFGTMGWIGLNRHARVATVDAVQFPIRGFIVIAIHGIIQQTLFIEKYDVRNSRVRG